MWPFKRKPQEPKQKRQCAQCGKAFELPVGRIANSRSGLLFCSPKCSGAYQSAQKSVPNAQCRTCGEVFHRSPANFKVQNTHAYCSKDCYSKARKSGMAEVRKPERPASAELMCEHCGKTFQISQTPRYYYQRRFCSKECKRQAHISVGSFVPIELVRRRDHNRCAACGCADVAILEVHHKDRDRQNNNLDNLILLCPNCHTKLHRNVRRGLN